jgi:hypothetical protein
VAQLAAWCGSDSDPVPAVRDRIVSRRELFERLGRAARITEVSASAGSGKTFLLRSWIAEGGAAAAGTVGDARAGPAAIRARHPP